MGPDGGTPVGRELILPSREDETAMAWPGDHDPLDSLEEGTARSLVPVIPSPTRMISINYDGPRIVTDGQPPYWSDDSNWIGSGRSYWQKRRPCVGVVNATAVDHASDGE